MQPTEISKVSIIQWHLRKFLIRNKQTDSLGRATIKWMGGRTPLRQLRTSNKLSVRTQPRMLTIPNIYAKLASFAEQRGRQSGLWKIEGKENEGAAKIWQDCLHKHWPDGAWFRFQKAIQRRVNKATACVSPVYKIFGNVERASTLLIKGRTVTSISTAS